jgi:hypothetical protein
MKKKIHGKYKPKNVKKIIKRIADLSKSKCGAKHKPSIRQIIKEEGMSQCYADNPGRLFSTTQAKDLIAKYLPDELIYKTHGELIRAGEISHYVFPVDRRHKDKQITNEEIKIVVESVPGCKLIYIKRDDYLGAVAYFQAPDNRNRSSAVDMAYKVKGHYAPEQIELTKRKYQNLSNAELVEFRNTLKAFLLKK